MTCRNQQNEFESIRMFINKKKKHKKHQQLHRALALESQTGRYLKFMDGILPRALSALHEKKWERRPAYACRGEVQQAVNGSWHAASTFPVPLRGRSYALPCCSSHCNVVPRQQRDLFHIYHRTVPLLGLRRATPDEMEILAQTTNECNKSRDTTYYGLHWTTSAEAKANWILVVNSGEGGRTRRHSEKSRSARMMAVHTKKT